jgi:hypothetical protein
VKRTGAAVAGPTMELNQKVVLYVLLKTANTSARPGLSFVMNVKNSPVRE